MDIIFGRSTPISVSDYFKQRVKLDGHRILSVSMGEFSDGEPFAELLDKPSGEPSVIFESPANSGPFNSSSYFMQMSACADNLKENGSGPIWAVMPLAFCMRQDRIRKDKYESQMARLAPKFMKAAGIDGMSTVEAHSQKALEFCEASFGKGNVININPNPVFAYAMQKYGIGIESVANPDMGADARAEDLATRLGLDRFSLKKKRNAEGTKITGQSGVVSASTALIDDMASSLGTAKDAIELLYDRGSKENVLLISHAIMTGDAWNNLAKLIRGGKLQKIFFLPTIDRDREFLSFRQQYPDIAADSIVFLSDVYNEMMYDHVTKTIAAHPLMTREVA